MKINKRNRRRAKSASTYHEGYHMDIQFGRNKKKCAIQEVNQIKGNNRARLCVMGILFLTCTGILSGCGSTANEEPVNLAADVEHLVETTGELSSQVVEEARQASAALAPLGQEVTVYGRSVLEINYGENESMQNLDLYLPEGEGPFPLVVFIHGGGWMSGSKRDGQQYPWTSLVDEGYALASLNYALAPEYPWPQGLEDCQQAIQWLVRYAEELNLDARRIGVAGDSSGGHYALFLAAMADETMPVQCTAAWFPVTDLPDLVGRISQAAGSEREEAAQMMMQFYIESIMPVSDLQGLVNASPISWIHEGMGPILLQHGDADILVDPSQSERYYEQALQEGIEIELDFLPGAGHCDRAFETQENLDRVRMFFDTWLKG